MANTTDTDLQTLALLRSLVTSFEEKKAENLTVLKVSAQSNITDFLVLATGNSEPHLRALRIEAEKVLDAAKIPIAGMDQGGFGSGWTVVDAYQIMLHFFTAEQRANYALEKLWKDAEVVDLKTLETKAKPKAAAPKKATKPVAAPVKSKAAKTVPAKKTAAAKTKPAAKAPVKAAGKTVAKAAAKKPAAKKPAAKKASKG